MRGNSRCDPILSMSIIDQRILMNTENNIILMEFESVQYEYGSSREEISETGAAEERQLYKKQQKQFYSTKRACRMELLQTPNTKLFNDHRKNVMNHSSRPLSNKNIRDAHLIHTILSTKENNQLITNSAGHMSESALNKRRSVMHSINAIITSHSPSSISSNASFRHHNELNSSLNQTSSMDYNEKENQKKLEITLLDTSQTEHITLHTAIVKPPSNLFDTKQFLREQLKEIKQAGQNQDEINYSKISANKEHDSKSCMDSTSIMRLKAADDYENMITGINMSLRVLSARPSFDTKTKIKLKAQDLSNMKLVSNNKLGSSEDLTKSDQQQQQQQQQQAAKQTNPNPQTIVTKVFETQESDLKSKVSNLNFKFKSY